MGSVSWVHWLIALVFLVGPMFPISQILKKAGLSPWWALLYVVPLVNLMGLFVFGYSRWPAGRDQISN